MIRALDAEVALALEHAGLRVRTFLDITTIRFPTFRRATYRIDLETGETIKARCLEDEGSARRLFEIRRDLPDAFVPAFDHHGRVLLERWVHGRILDATEPDPAQLVEAGVLLASLHATSAVAEGAAQDEATSAWRLKTEDGLRTLLETGSLGAREADQLSRVFLQDDPGRAVIGLGHCDFCGENMVIDDSGRLRVFDNERVGVCPLGFDLARAWYRWGLSPESWALFRNAYASSSTRDEPLASLDFWRIAVLVQSACLRLSTDRAHLSAPLDKLVRMAVAKGGAAR